MTTIATSETPTLEALTKGTCDRLNRRFAYHDLRFATATLDALQTAVVGFGVAQSLPSVNRAIDSWETAVIAVTVAVTAAALRLAMRAANPAGTGALWLNGASAARAAALAVLLVGLEHWLASTLPLQSWVVGIWLLSWATLAAVNAYGLRVVACRLSRTIAIQPQFFLFGEAGHTASLADKLAIMLGTHADRVLQIDDRKPAEVACLPLGWVGRDDIVLLVAETLDTVRINELFRKLAHFPGKVCLAMPIPFVAPLPRAVPRCGDYLLIDLVTDPHGGACGALKRLIDLVGAGVLLMLLSPLMLCAAAIIPLESPGSILFRQKRFGIGGQPIEVLKFRTMYAERCDANGANATIARDPRVTPIGRILRRLSIDELPQLFNVLRGDMSLVGPRPHPLHMLVEGAYYYDVVGTYHVRHRVKPGITGWAQINGSRGVVDTLDKAQRRVALDLWYLNHWSLSLDARILLRTVLGGFASCSAD